MPKMGGKFNNKGVALEDQGAECQAKKVQDYRAFTRNN